MRATCTHIALHCRDIEASVAFYMRHVGLHEVHRRCDSDMTVVWLGEHDRRDPFVIVLLGTEHGDSAEPPPVAHLGYAVAAREDVDRIARDATDQGLAVVGPVYAGAIVGYFCMIRDPDGNWVEFSFGQSLGQELEKGSQEHG
ncbi:MAG TPA: VOC family protein [Candidatus Limnocylindrales bacterium]|nr:VOC family protein [Candidatus Limnocylindrales bacterium]